MAGQIIKRGDKTWLVRIFTGRDGKGKRQYLNKTVRGTKKDAETYLSKTLTEISSGTFVESSPVTIESYLEKWLTTAARPRLRDNTYREYSGLIDRYIKPVMGGKRLSDVRPLDVQAFYSSLSEKGLSPRTIRFTHSVLASAFKQAVRWRMLAHNPCDAVELPRKAAKEMQSLTPAEATSFLQEAANDRWFALFVLALATGLRPSEYFGLKWSDVDLEHGLVTVQRSLIWRSYKSGDWYFGEPKTPRSRRRIPLPSSVVRALSEHRRRQAEGRLKAGAAYQNLDLVFATSEGQPLIRLNVIQKHFKPILKRAKLLKLYASMICATPAPRSCLLQMRTRRLLASVLGTLPSLLLWTFTRTSCQTCSKGLQTSWKISCSRRPARNRGLFRVFNITAKTHLSLCLPNTNPPSTSVL